MTGGNDYIITVKGNQPKLHQAIAQTFEQHSPTSCHVEHDHSHGRDITRTISVLPPPAELDPAWIGVRSVVKVERIGRRGHKPFSETMFYITSLDDQAQALAERIRAHWHIENRLHWTKDVVLKEDATPVCDGHAIINFAILRTIAINLFRANGFASITQGIRMLAHDIRQLFSFL